MFLQNILSVQKKYLELSLGLYYICFQIHKNMKDKIFYALVTAVWVSVIGIVSFGVLLLWEVTVPYWVLKISVTSFIIFYVSLYLVNEYMDED